MIRHAMSRSMYCCISGFLCIFRLLWTAVHRQSLRLREDHIVGEVIIHVRSDVLRFAPSGRSVFFTLTELLAIFALHVDRQLEQCSCRYTDEQVNRIEAGQRIGKRAAEVRKASGELA